MNENQTKKEKKEFYIIKLVQEDHGKLSIFHDIQHFLSLQNFIKVPLDLSILVI